MRKVYLPDNFNEKNEFWNKVWSRCFIEDMLSEVETNFMKPIFSRFFSRTGRILEGGCGLGKYVIYYRRKGYDIEGVDFSAEAVKKAKEYDPSLPVKQGNLSSLGHKDNYFSAYFSGGVIEHYEDSAEPILKEARRVLKEDGVFIITVPYVNLKKCIEDLLWFTILRKKKRILSGESSNSHLYCLTGGCNQDLKPYINWRFHQYEYKRSEIVKILCGNGFHPIYIQPVQVNWNLRKIFRIVDLINNTDKAVKPGPLNLIKTHLLCEDGPNFLSRCLMRFLGLLFANQIAIVCKKG